MRLFKQDLSAEQIAGRLEVVYPEQAEKQASTSTIYTVLYGETAKDSGLKSISGKPAQTEGGKRPSWPDT
jgi:IS30 family transposase